MKKLLVALLVAVTTSLTVTAQGISEYPISNPHIVISGSFNSTITNTVNAFGNTTIMPYYSKLDTPVANTGADSFTAKIQGAQRSVYTWCHVNTYVGSCGSCTLSLYASGDTGVGKDWGSGPLYTTTLNPATTSQVVTYLFGSGWPYTNFKWVFKGGGTQTSSWYSGVMVRYKDDDEEYFDKPRGWRRENDVL